MTRRPTRKASAALASVPELSDAEARVALTAERDQLTRAWTLRSSTPGERIRFATIENALARKTA